MMRNSTKTPLTKDLMRPAFVGLFTISVFVTTVTALYTLSTLPTNANIAMSGTIGVAVTIPTLFIAYFAYHVAMTTRNLGHVDMRASVPAMIGYFGSHMTSEEQDKVPHVKTAYNVDYLLEQPLEDRLYEAELEGSAVLLTACRLYVGRHTWAQLYTIPFVFTTLWVATGILSGWTLNITLFGGASIAGALLTVAALRTIVPRVIAARTL